MILRSRVWHLCCRYVIHLWDLNHEGTWEGKGTYVYYTDFVMELTLVSLDLMHHIHMLVCFSGQALTEARDVPRQNPCLVHEKE